MNFYKETTICSDVAMTYTNHKKVLEKIPFMKILKNRFSRKNTPKQLFFDKLELKKILIEPISVSNKSLFVGIIRILQKVMMTLQKIVFLRYSSLNQICEILYLAAKLRRHADEILGKKYFLILRCLNSILPNF